jgi:putative Holliday junction resolvase
MGRIIAIDYGIKRTGIAVTDELQLIANPLTTVETNKLMPFFKEYFQQEKVDTLVVGLPRDMKFHYSESMKYIERFAQNFKKKYPAIPLVFQDERFTSKMAKDSILAAGKKKKDRQDKSLVDKLSACIILQSYMQKIN